MEDFWNAVLHMIKHVPKAQPRAENTSRNFGPSALPWCAAVTDTPLGAIAAMIRVQFQDPQPGVQSTQDRVLRISGETFRAGVEYQDVDGHRKMRICLLNGFDHWP
jgi:hypothetical protein